MSNFREIKAQRNEILEQFIQEYGLVQGTEKMVALMSRCRDTGPQPGAGTPSQQKGLAEQLAAYLNWHRGNGPRPTSDRHGLSATQVQQSEQLSAHMNQYRGTDHQPSQPSQQKGLAEQLAGYIDQYRK